MAADFFHSFFWGADDGDMGMGAEREIRGGLRFTSFFLNMQCPWRQIAAATEVARGCCLIRGFLCIRDGCGGRLPPLRRRRYLFKDAVFVANIGEICFEATASRLFVAA
ncbi:MAG: hypothetical protein II875_12550, partial [Clostridia bacterium]|nr:hypothetical protein [Clostridia bacterium]